MNNTSLSKMKTIFSNKVAPVPSAEFQSLLVRLKCWMCRKEMERCITIPTIFGKSMVCSDCFARRLRLKDSDILAFYEKEICFKCENYIDCITSDGIVGPSRLSSTWSRPGFHSFLVDCSSFSKLKKSIIEKTNGINLDALSGA